MQLITSIVMLSCAMYNYITNEMETRHETEEINCNNFEDIYIETAMDFWDHTDDSNRFVYSELSDDERYKFNDSIEIMVRHKIKPEITEQ